MITAGDFELLAGGVYEQLGIPDGSRAEAVREGYRSWWRQLSATCDQDGDGRISTREFQAGAAHVFLSQDPAASMAAFSGG